MEYRAPARFYDADHAEAVYVATSSEGTSIVVGPVDGDDPDVWMPLETAERMARDILARVREVHQNC